MIISLNKIRQKIGNWKIVIIFGILYIISQLIIVSILHNLDTKQVFELQTTFSSDTFHEIINSWKNNGILGFYKKHFIFDFPHPIWYSIFFGSFMSKLFHLNLVGEKYNYLILLPFIAGILDLLENILHVVIVLSDISNISKIAVLISGMATNLKWFFAFVSLFIIVVMIIKYFRYKNDKT